MLQAAMQNEPEAVTMIIQYRNRNWPREPLSKAVTDDENWTCYARSFRHQVVLYARAFEDSYRINLSHLYPDEKSMLHPTL